MHQKLICVEHHNEPTKKKQSLNNNQDEAFTDFFARVGIDPNNELKESLKRATKSKVIKETKVFIPLVFVG